MIKKINKILSQDISKADLHIHSNRSDGKGSIEEILAFAEEKTDLKVIAITDHDTITGGVMAKEMAKKKKYNIEVVVGEEITSTDGHILGLFLHSPIRPGLSASETIKLIHHQGGIAIPAHPFLKTRIKSPNFVTMDGVGLKGLLSEKFDAIETINGALPSSRNSMASLVNRTFLFKNETGGSDAHIIDAIGSGYTLFYGHTAEDLKISLKKRLYTQSSRRHWHFREFLLYFVFFFPKGINLLKSFLFADPVKSLSAIRDKQFNTYLREKKALKKLISESTKNKDKSAK
jgi:predicted metal-dependent phosphoesterase TrpH